MWDRPNLGLYQALVGALHGSGFAGVEEKGIVVAKTIKHNFDIQIHLQEIYSVNFIISDISLTIYFWANKTVCPFN